MTSRSRVLVLAISTPIIAFAFIGGYLGQALAKDDTYQHLRVFEDVVSLVINNYVEPVDVKEAMKGAMRGLADNLDPDSAFLTPDLVRTREANDPGGPAETGLDVTRQYYLRVVSARDGSPAAKAGIRPGDFIRAIDNRPTRDMSAYEGSRLLRGAPGTKVSLLLIRGNAADPHMVDLVRERIAGPEVTSRMADGPTGYVRVLQFSPDSPARLKQAIDALAKTGAARYVIDLRGTSRGDLDGLDLHVRHQALLVNRVAGRREVAQIRQPETALVGQPHHALPCGAAEGVRADQIRAIVAGERGGKDFRRSGRPDVDEQRHRRGDRAVRGLRGNRFLVSSLLNDMANDRRCLSLGGSAHFDGSRSWQDFLRLCYR